MMEGESDGVDDQKILLVWLACAVDGELHDAAGKRPVVSPHHRGV